MSQDPERPPINVGQCWRIHAWLARVFEDQSRAYGFAGHAYLDGLEHGLCLARMDVTLTDALLHALTMQHPDITDSEVEVHIEERYQRVEQLMQALKEALGP